MPLAGWRCLIRRGGAPTPLSDTMAHLGGGVVEVSTPAFRCVAPDGVTITVDATPVAVLGATYEFGRFVIADPGAGAVAISGDYIPLGTPDIVSDVKSVSISEASDPLDRTVFNEVHNLRRRIVGLADCTISLSVITTGTNVKALRDLKAAGDRVLLEITFGTVNRFRGWGKITSIDQEAAVDGLVEATVEWVLAAQRDPSGNISGYSEVSL
jgi:hypothetical protein